jgi:hypothetical protein
MHIEIALSSEYRYRELERIQLEHDLKKWAYLHNIDLNLIRLKYNSDRNVEQITIANDRALELFALSWPHDKFTLRR